MNKLPSSLRATYNRHSRCFLKNRLINLSIRNVTSAETSEVAEMKLNEVLSNVEPRIERRNPPIKPFMRELFIGEFNKDLLAFPEILNKEELDSMNIHTENIERFTAKKNYTSKDFSTYLKNIKMFGAPGIVFHGGLAANTTERCKFLESIAHDVQAAVAIRNHWVGIDMVKNGMDQERSEKIVPQLVAGDAPINIVFTEKDSEDPESPGMNCMAKANIKGEWTITGEKIFSGKRLPGYFIVFCNVQHETLQPFLVYPGAVGIKMTDSSISFNQTPATLLGRKFGESSEKDFEKTANLITGALAQNRLYTAAITVGHLRNVINSYIKHIRNKYMQAKSFSELPMLQNAVSEAVTTLYGAESMVYFTAGLNDGYETPDTDLEMMICKMYATKKAFDSINGLMETLGMIGLPENFTKHMNDARELLMLDEPNYKLNMYIGLSGIQYAGKTLATEVGQGRNPFAFPFMTIKKMIKDRHQVSDRPKMVLRLHENLHPSLQDTALILEYCVLRMKYATEVLLFRHGMDVIEEHRSLTRLGEIAMEVFASTASISRASRSYCIGLHMGANEMVVSTHLTSRTKEIVSKLVQDICDDYILCRDHFRGDIAEKSLKYGSSHYEHCLERVYF